MRSTSLTAAASDTGIATAFDTVFDIASSDNTAHSQAVVQRGQRPTRPQEQI